MIDPAAPEHALVIPCEGSRLIAILSPGVRGRGVVIVVGGPQYRVGSHRQFVQLARALSVHGVPVLRFDYRGMGDSEGTLRGFEFIAADIRAAVDSLLEHQPHVREVVLWGLCDAASASLLYAPRDSRVIGVTLLNPWVRTAQTEARARLRHYYVQRLLSREFWRKLRRGGLDPMASIRSLAAHLRSAFTRAAVQPGGSGERDEPEMWRGGPPTTLPDLASRMVAALRSFPGRVLLIISGEDLTAAEFLDVTRASKEWRVLLAADRVTTHHLAESNHTFSQPQWKKRVEIWTCEWLDAW